MIKIILHSVLLTFVIHEFVFCQNNRPRDLGIEIGLFEAGKWNAITDVKGVEVGHETIISSDNIRLDFDCTYQTLVNADSLNFNINYPIHNYYL